MPENGFGKEELVRRKLSLPLRKVRNFLLNMVGLDLEEISHLMGSGAERNIEPSKYKLMQC